MMIRVGETAIEFNNTSSPQAHAQGSSEKCCKENKYG